MIITFALFCAVSLAPAKSERARAPSPKKQRNKLTNLRTHTQTASIDDPPYTDTLLFNVYLTLDFT